MNGDFQGGQEKDSQSTRELRFPVFKKSSEPSEPSSPESRIAQKIKDNEDPSWKDWLGEIWNSAIRGVGGFSYNLRKNSGLADEKDYASFLEVKKNEYPDLYESYQNNLKANSRFPAQSVIYSIDDRKKLYKVGEELETFRREGVKEGGVEVAGFKVPQEKAQKIKKTLLGGTLTGLTESIPAMVLSAPTMGVAFFDMAYQGADEEIKRLEREKGLELSQSDKETYKLAIAVPSMILERVGLSGVLKNTAISKRLASLAANRVIKRVVALGEGKVTAATFNKIAREEAKGLKGFVERVGTGFLSEAETGGLQQLAADAVEQSMNMIKGKEIFDPKTAGEIAYDAIYAAVQEGIGGGIISTVVGGTSKPQMTLEEKKQVIEFVETLPDLEDVKDYIVENAKGGNIERGAAKRSYDTIKNYKEALSKIPDGLSEDNKVEALDLVLEKQKLQKQAEGLDSSIREKLIDPQIKAVEEQLVKVISNDIKTEEQVPSTEQEREAAVKAQPDTEASEAAVETGGAVQLDEETQGELDDVMRDADFTVSEQEAPTRTSKTDAYADEGVQGGIINLIKTKGGELGREFVGAVERIKSTLGEGYRVVVLDEARYRDVTNTTGRGAYDAKNKVLYLNAQQVRNLDKDNVRAVYHEAIHPILTKKFGEASADFIKFKQDLVNAIKRSLSEQDAATLIARLEAFEKQYKKDKTTEQQAEEFMTELGAIMTSEDVELLKKSGLLNRVKELINNLLRKLGMDISLDTENEVVEFMNSLAKGVRGGVAVADIVGYDLGKEAKTLDELIDGEAGVAIGSTERTDFQESRKITIPKTDFTADIPQISLGEALEKYGVTEGDKRKRYAIITSDFTKVGYDSLNQPINGGIGFVAIKKNVDDGVGFASIEESTAKALFTRLRNNYGDNKNIVVLIMLQSPSSTIGNHYGAKYMYRALKALKSDIGESAYLDALDKSMTAQLYKDLKGSKITKEQIFELFNQVDVLSQEDFVDNLIRKNKLNTSLDFRRGFGRTVLFPTIVTGKKKKKVERQNPVAIELNRLGFNMDGFLDEYGQKEFMIQEMLDTDKSSYMVAGFQVNTANKEDAESAVEQIQSGGILHGLFDGKVPAVKGTNFYLDGLYEVRKNFGIDFIEWRVDKIGSENRKKVDAYSRRKYKKPFTSLSQEKKDRVKEWGIPKGLFIEVKPEQSTSPSRIAQGIPAVSERGVEIEPVMEEEAPLVESRRGTTKLIRDISVLITPATVREATPLTKKIKALSEKYDKLVKQFSKTKEKETLDEIRKTEAQILNSAKQEITEEVSKIKGVSVSFDIDNRGLWDGSFEPSLNMMLSITSQADTEAASKLLFDFAEKYSQDAFILEADSNFEQDVMNGERMMPLTEFDEFGLMHYPQIVYTFSESLTDEQVGDLSVSLQDNGVDAFTINNDEVKISVIKFFPEDSQLNETEQYEERKKDFEAKSRAAKDSALDVLGRNVSYTPNVRIRKSSYQGARNEGTEAQTREYDRSDVFKPFKEAEIKKEAPLQESRNLAPNGQPSNLNDEQYKIVRTPEFKRWFGDWENDPENASKVVDENGEPLVMYHGMPHKFEGDAFKIGYKKSNRLSNHDGIYFTADRGRAEDYAKKDGNVTAVFLSIKSPYIEGNPPSEKGVEWFMKNFYKEDNSYYNEKLAQFKSNSNTSILSGRDKTDLAIVEGYDGKFDGSFKYGDTVIFKPNQAKLADGSNRTFDPEKEGLKESRNFDRKTEKAMEGFAYDPKIDERINEKNKRSFTQQVKRGAMRFNWAWFDRQGDIRRKFIKAGDLISQAGLTTRYGSSASAKMLFDKFNKKIYGTLKGNKKKLLSEVIMLRRIISIYDGFDRSIEEFELEIKDLKAKKSLTKKEAVRLAEIESKLKEKKKQRDNFKNPRKLNRNSALARLDEIKQKLRDETGNDQQFFDIDNRATQFFSVMRNRLKKMLDEGLITQDEYFRLSKYEYSPRMFVDKVFDLESGDFKKHEKRFMSYGLSENEFKRLKEGSEEDLFVDGEFLLRMVLSSTESRILANRLYKGVAKNADKYDWVLVQPRKIDELNKEIEELQEKKDKTKDERKRLAEARKERASEIREFKKSLKGFSEVGYKEGGVRKELYIKDEMMEQMENPDEVLKSGRAMEMASYWLGAKFLRQMATGINVMFPLSNIPMDFRHIVMFTDVFDDNKSVGQSMLQLGGSFTKKIWGLSRIGKAVSGKDTKSEALLEEALEHGMGMDWLDMRTKVKFTGRLGTGIKKVGQTIFDNLQGFSEASEIAMRLAVYQKAKETALEKRKNGVGGFKDMSDTEIKMYAAHKGRTTIDFAQGGAYAKSWDKFSPYVNAKLQGGRVSFRYAVENKEKMAKKWAETSLYVGAFFGFLAQALFDWSEWDEEDKKAIPRWHILNYHILPLPDFISKVFFDDNHKHYLKIRKNPITAPFDRAAEHGGEYIYRKMKGDMTDAQIDKMHQDAKGDFITGVIDAAPFADLALGTDDEGNVELQLGVLNYMSPAIKAANQYRTNYDYFRDKTISYDKLYQPDISPELEGYNSEYVEDFYKEIGKAIGASPQRMKSSVEVITTSPSTNVLVGLTYGALNSIIGELDALSLKPMTDGAKNRMFGTANKDFSRSKPSKELSESLREYEENRFKVRKDLEKMVFRDKASVQEGKQYIGTIEDSKLVEYAENKYNKLKRKNEFHEVAIPNKSAYYTLDDYISENPELAAEYLFNEFGSLTNQELREVAGYISMIRGTRSFSYPPAFMRKYRELQK